MSDYSADSFRCCGTVSLPADVRRAVNKFCERPARILLGATHHSVVVEISRVEWDLRFAKEGAADAL